MRVSDGRWVVGVVGGWGGGLQGGVLICLPIALAHLCMVHSMLVVYIKGPLLPYFRLDSNFFTANG